LKSVFLQKHFTMNKFFLPVLLACLFPFGVAAQVNPASSGARDYAIAVAWQQHSGEYRALAFQAYNFATLSLQNRLNDSLPAKPNCVIVDIDETVLDNSPFQGEEVKKDVSFDPKDWTVWTNLAKADTVPGALSFLKFAAAKDVETFYVTNRDQADRQATLLNLQQLGFPFADEAHLMVNTNTSNKEPRRQNIADRYNILLLCGDNLSDFSNIFYREQKNTREEVDRARNEFGTHFIVLPNPMYGDWEKPLYKGPHLTEAEKSGQRLNGLKGY
jgi:5'-nucleotidase (lipoprotein e(P4) family)